MRQPPAIRQARNVREIHSQRLDTLNRGECQTATYIEMMAVEFAALLEVVAPEIPASESVALQQIGVCNRMRVVGHLLDKYCDWGKWEQCIVHPSDTIRGWAAYWLDARAHLSLNEKFALIQPLADDLHFGVREWAWLALRPTIAEQIEYAIDLLKPWTTESSASLRRFAIESTRPRGFWSRHIDTLKKDPNRGLVLLQPLMSDPSRYVQLSVGNWLNDVAKSDLTWVERLCENWLQQSLSASTQFIVKRALRSKRS